MEQHRQYLRTISAESKTAGHVIREMADRCPDEWLDVTVSDVEKYIAAETELLAILRHKSADYFEKFMKRLDQLSDAIREVAPNHEKLSSAFLVAHRELCSVGLENKPKSERLYRRLRMLGKSRGVFNTICEFMQCEQFENIKLIMQIGGFASAKRYAEIKVRLDVMQMYRAMYTPE